MFMIFSLLVFEVWWIVSQSKWVKAQYDNNTINRTNSIISKQALAGGVMYLLSELIGIF